jgi:membrane-bound serine protease (ClpP class)
MLTSVLKLCSLSWLLLALLLTLGGRPALAAEPASPSAQVESSAVKVGYVPIEGVIDDSKAAYFKRSLKAAEEQQLTHLVVHFTTPGGALGAGMEMLNAALSVPQNKPRLIAFVDDHSLSAGSLVAYGHDEVLVTSKALLGDIGVITQGADGKIEYLPEKIETVVRALLRNTAQHRGWDEAKMVKMTARNQELYRFTVPAVVAAPGVEAAPAKEAFVIQDDLGTWLAAHPEVKPESKVLVLGADRLLSYTARDAVAQGMATALVADLDAVYQRLGVAATDVHDLSPTATEKTAWTLAGFAPMLAALALLLVFLEFKMPMGGLWLVLAAVVGTAFFVCQFYLDLASSFEVVLIILGLLLIIVEVFAFPAGGLLAAGGALMVVAGLVLSFMPTASQFQPSTEGWDAMAVAAVWQSLTAIVVLTIGTTVVIATLPSMALRTGLADAAAIEGTSGGALEGEVATLVGKRGIAHTILRPGGQIRLDKRIIGAVSVDGGFIAEGAAVQVVAVHYGEVVVTAVATEV